MKILLIGKMYENLNFIGDLNHIINRMCVTVSDFNKRNNDLTNVIKNPNNDVFSISRRFSEHWFEILFDIILENSKIIKNRYYNELDEKVSKALLEGYNFESKKLPKWE